MKKITKLCIATLTFVFLFYNQDIGVNAALIALLIWFLLYQKPIKPGNKKEFWLLSSAIFLSSVSFAWYGDAFSFFAMFISVIVLGFQSQYPKINVVLYPFFMASELCSFYF